MGIKEVVNSNKVITLILLNTCALLLDKYTPLGTADGLGYIAVLVSTLLIRDRLSTPLSILSGIVFCIAGFHFSPEGIHSIGIINRIECIFLLIMIGILIIDKKKTIAELRSANSNLENVVRERDQAIEQLSKANSRILSYTYESYHQMREPLRNIQSFTQLLLRQVNISSSSNESDYAKHIESGVSQLSDIIVNMRKKYLEVQNGKLDT